MRYVIHLNMAIDRFIW